MQKAAVIVLGFLFLVSAAQVFAGEPAWQEIGRGNMNLGAMLADADNPRQLYFGSDKGVFKSEDAGQSWRNILSVRGENRQVNFLCFSPQDKNTLYAATGNGLYYSVNQGRSWSRIFKGRNFQDAQCTAIAVPAGVIYLGTQSGLFMSNDRGRSWQKAAGQVSDGSILAIASNVSEPDCVYAVATKGIFRSEDAGRTWERIFVSRATENSSEAEEINEDFDAEKEISDIRYIALDPDNSRCLYLATAKGAYISRDRGASWNLLSEYGLLSREVRFLLAAKKSKLYAVSRSGIFEYVNERWQELSFALTAGEVRFLALGSNGNLYAACEKGLFRMNPADAGTAKAGNTLAFYVHDEPKINEVQKAAIKYAEVQPEKIKLWRRQATARALLPKVTAGVNRDTSDLWHWESGSSTKSGDDVLVRGRDNVAWDVSVGWDLGDLVWNDAQTSIDVRSRLMVQLREDILDEVNKYYFERIRVKSELDNLSIEDRKKRFEKELRLQELTASLDALTGGYFSRQLK